MDGIEVIDGIDVICVDKYLLFRKIIFGYILWLNWFKVDWWLEHSSVDDSVLLNVLDFFVNSGSLIVIFFLVLNIFKYFP